MIRKLVASSAPAIVLALAVVGCGGSEPPPPEAPANPPAPTAEPAKAAEPTAAAPVAEPKKEEPKKSTPALVVKDVGFATPESVLYDATDDVYFVSNINGSPGDKDNNGFISKVSPDGKVIDLKFIEGGKKGVKLDAPKGLTIVGDVLYVADLTQVRAFDRKTGKQKADVKLEGATFVNDVSNEGGKVYASDTGIKFTDKGAESTNTAAVWVIEKGKAKGLAKGEELGGPNGLSAGKDGVWVVTFGSGELYKVDEKGKRQQIQKLPKGMLDGITVAGDTVLISSWESSTIYRGKPGGTFEPVVVGVKAPADIGFDTKRNRVLVPLFQDNAIEVYDIK